MASSSSAAPVLDILTVAIDREGCIISWNPKAAELLGYTSEEVLGRQLQDYIVAPAERVVDRLDEIARGSSELDLWLSVEGGRSFICSRFAVKHSGPRYFHLFSTGHTPPAEELADWPVAVMPVPGCGLAAFAKRAYDACATVFEEEPFFTRLQPAAMKGRKEWTEAWSEAFGAIRAPLRFPGEDAASATPLLASSALVRDALGFAVCPEGVRQTLLGLSHPPLELEHALVEVAGQVARLCVEHLRECRRFDARLLQAGILAQEMNVFPGGRLFWSISRANHSCAPNCVFNSVPGRWGLRTIRPVWQGEELTVSYLGEELLWPTEPRQRALWRSKCFVCRCQRCTAAADPMRDRPCIICMSRSFRCWRVIHRPGVWCRTEASTQSRATGMFKTGETVATTGRMESNTEGEWIEVDPEQHSRGGWMLVNGAALGLGQLLIPSSAPSDPAGAWRHGGQGMAEPGSLAARFRSLTGRAAPDPGERARWYDSRKLEDLLLPRHCLEASPLASETGAQGTAYAHSIDGCWRCPRCGCEERRPELRAAEAELGDAARKVFRLDQSEHTHTNVGGAGRGIAMPDDRFVLDALRLADDAGAAFGRRHWIWQLGLLYAVDLDLSIPKWTTLRVAPSYYLGTASALLEVWDWVGSLGLSSEPGLWLYKRATGLLRVLDSWSFLDTAFDSAREEVRRRVESYTPFVDLLGPREFIPQSLFIAN